MVTIDGLPAGRHGLPLGYEVFDGNRADVTTVEEIVEAMEAKYGRVRRVWVLDRGMVDEDNLAFIRERGGSYIVGTPRTMLRQYERSLTESGWTSVYEDLEVKLCPSPADGASPAGDETFVLPAGRHGLCRSKARAQKEKAMHERFSTRFSTTISFPCQRQSEFPSVAVREARCFPAYL